MAHQIVRPGRGRSPKRKTLWLDFAGVFVGKTVVAGATAVLLTSLNAAGLALRPFTIVRTRGLLMAITDQVAATEEPFGALGFAVVSDQASAIGVTAVPTPIVDAGSSLFFSWTPWYASIGFSTGSGLVNYQYTTEFDSKAMRKVEVGEDIIATVENGSATDGAQFMFMARMLIKTN